MAKSDRKLEWFRQIIPSDCKLIHLLEDIQKACLQLNKDVLDYDYDYEDDSIDGRITMSSDGVHCVTTLSSDEGTGSVVLRSTLVRDPWF